MKQIRGDVRVTLEPRAASATSEPLRLQALSEHRHPVDVTELDGHVASGMKVHFAEELQPAVRRQIALSRRWRLGEHQLRSEGGRALGEVNSGLTTQRG